MHRGFEWRFEIRAEGLGKTYGNHPESQMAGANTVRSERLSLSGALRRGLERGFVLQQRGALGASSARSGGLDDVDGGPDCRVYIQMRGIEQVRVLGLF
jgi:hypothetical protein